MENPICGNEYLESLFKKKFKSTDFKQKSIPPSSVVVKKLPNNPYLSSITGKYAFDLSKINNFSLYFWKSTDDISKNPAVEFVLDDNKSPAFDWSDYYQSQTLNALTQYTSFLNKTSSITDSYEKSDIVCVLFETTKIGAASTGPYSIYDIPSFVDNKIILFLSKIYATIENIKEGGWVYYALIHEFGHGFGLGHPYDTFFESTIMPGIGNIKCNDTFCSGTEFRYPAIAGYINNS